MAYINLAQVMYPVGAIYASSSSTSPASLFSGTWSQLTGDACLMAGTAVGNVGSKTISINQMPQHSHTIHVDTWASNFGGWGIATSNGSADYWTNIDDPIGAVGGGKLFALLLQMLYVEAHGLTVRSKLAAQVKETYCLTQEEVNYGLR